MTTSLLPLPTARESWIFALLTATCRRRPSCRWARRRASRASIPTSWPASARRSCLRTPTTSTSGRERRPSEALGGLHRFMAWSGPILTDSGGFQVFSLRDTILGLDDDGVTLRSVYDGSPGRLTPASVAEIQRRLGSDIAMCLDVCPPADVPRWGPDARGRADDDLGTTPDRLAARQGQLVFGITQGATDPELRRRSIEEVCELGFDGQLWADCPSGRAATRCSTRWHGRRRCCRPIVRGTSWGSAIRSASSR